MTKYVLSAFANANKIFHRSNDCWILQNSLNMHKQTKANTKTIGYFRPFFFLHLREFHMKMADQFGGTNFTLITNVLFSSLYSDKSRRDDFSLSILFKSIKFYL